MLNNVGYAFFVELDFILLLCNSGSETG